MKGTRVKKNIFSFTSLTISNQVPFKIMGQPMSTMRHGGGFYLRYTEVIVVVLFSFLVIHRSVVRERLYKRTELIRRTLTPKVKP